MWSNKIYKGKISYVLTLTNFFTNYVGAITSKTLTHLDTVTSTVANKVKHPIQISFTLINPIPTTGSIVIKFPA